LLPLVIKTDVQGSLEALDGSLVKLGSDEVGVQVLFGGVGGITESDVILAQALARRSSASTCAANTQARERARRDGVEIRYYNIIYNVIDDVKAALSGMLAPETRERFLGKRRNPRSVQHLEGRQGRGLPRHEGVVRRGAKVRLIRDDVVIHEGDLVTLKRFKDEVREVQTGRNAAWRLPTTRNPEGRRDRVLRGRDRQADALGVERDGLSLGV